MTTLPQTTHATGSSTTYIKGETLASTEALEDFIDGFADIWSDVIEDILTDARNEARKTARNIPEWRDYADLIDVEFKDSEFRYVLVGDEERVNEAMRLEFGMPGSPPSSVLRKQAASQEVEYNNMISNALLSEALDG